MAACEACHNQVEEPMEALDESPTTTTGGRVSFELDGVIGEEEEAGGDTVEGVGDVVVGAQQGPMARGVRYWHSASFKYPVRP